MAGGSRRARPPAGLATSATTSGSRSRRPSSAPRRRSSSRSSAAATPAAARGAKPGAQPIQCPQCNGRGEIRSVRQTMLGQMVNVAPCPRCRGEGKVIERPVRRPAAARAAPSAGAASGSRSPPGIDEGHQIRLSNEGEVGPRGGPPGSLYVAVHVAGAPDAHPRGHGALLRGRPLDRPGRARARSSWCRRSRARTPRSRSSPAPSPGTEIRLRGRGVPHLRRQSVARRPPRDRQRRRPDEADASASASCSRQYAKDAGESVSPHAGPAREAGPRVSDGPRPAPAGARLDAAAGPLAGIDLDGRRRARRRGWSCRSPPTTRPSRPCPRSCRAPRPAGRPWSRRSSWSTRGWRAQVDLARPALVRAHLPLTDAAAVRAAVARAERELGHLQAFGLRPIGDLTARVVHEADWANAWKAHFPVLRVGRRIVIRPTWRRHQAPARRRGARARPGHGVRDRPPPDDPAVPRGARGLRRARARHRRRRPGSSTSAPAPGSWRSPPGCWARARCWRSTSTRSPSRPAARTPGATGSAASITAREGSSPSGEGPFDVVLANLIASAADHARRRLVEDVRPGGTLLASGIFENREAEVAEAFERPRPPASRTAGPRATGSRWS